MSREAIKIPGLVSSAEMMSIAVEALERLADQAPVQPLGPHTVLGDRRLDPNAYLGDRRRWPRREQG
ncbi:MAG TPA: hypothetical protein VFN81_06695 [Sphingomicrobium sp.]|nr:hypothetical protein [Sphingomicrobium sp.]